METLTRVMARTVYRIDLTDQPLHQLTRKDRVMRKFQRKISSGDNLKKSDHYGIGGRVPGANNQGQSKPMQVHRLESAGHETPAVSKLQPPSVQNLTRSASEPGMSVMPGNVKVSQNPHHHVNAIHSDSCLESEMESQELIPHKDDLSKQLDEGHDSEGW